MPVTKTRLFPFGEDVDVMIVCKNTIHHDQVVKALQMPAMYVTPFSAVTGRKFKRIIVFKDVYTSETQAQTFARWVNEDLRTSLDIGGELHII